MNRKWILMVIVMCPVMALAQTAPRPYQPAVPAATANYYGGGGWGAPAGASTAAGSAMNGMASVISSKGDYNLSTSAAAINMTQAQKNEIENRQQATDTYFEMRATNRAARKAERGPQPTMEQLARSAREAAPRPLDSSQWDRLTGKLLWPSALQQDIFDAQRGVVDQLFGKFATYGGLPYSDQTKVRQTVDSMSGELKSQIRQIPPPDYVACRGFLRSVLYAITKTDL